jgi:hypothetical protein
MQREIKFRGQRIDNNEWVCGYYVKDPKDQHRIYYKPFDDASSNTYYFVKPETIGQFTGLLDKNGKEIFERDIVKLTNSIRIFEYFKNCFWLIHPNREFKFPINMVTEEHLKETEVIGNIIDNPELLKE